jgi:glycogen debranching enzyme
MYASGSRFVEFLVRRRDRDGDGLLEWGGHAVLESVRDSAVPIWDLLGKDDPTAPSRVEALDLNTMLVREMQALAAMAAELGLDAESRSWRVREEALGRRVRETMWDRETRFFYNVDRETNRFVTSAGQDLRRMEIIGFLPLWAGLADPDQAAALAGHLTSPAKFWRRFGVPTLAADDPAYEPLVTRCCQWNGAVWIEWNYLVFDGLRRYGRHDLARQLADRMIEAAVTQLRRNHRFWESYSPDHPRVESPANYIWDSMLARVLIDLARPGI